jgi:hypothetical protein
LNIYIIKSSIYVQEQFYPSLVASPQAFRRFYGFFYRFRPYSYWEKVHQYLDHILAIPKWANFFKKVQKLGRGECKRQSELVLGNKNLQAR